MASESTVDLSLLLAHERWAARLARALVHDDDLAADILQEARVSFWRSGPDEPARARSWLAAVLRNLARDHGRRRARSDRATQVLAAEAEQVPSAEELAGRLEGHGLLATLVGELREPFRQAVLMRYYEGLNGNAIARRLGVPAATVRSRIKTGLDELRARLDERHGGRQRWVALMTALQAPPPTVPAAAPGGAFRLLAGAGLVATVALAAGLARTGCASPGQEQTSSRAASPSRWPIAAPGPPALRARGTGERQPGGDRAEIPAWALARAYPDRAIAGRVLADGQPLPGAILRLSAGMLTHARDLDRHTRSGPDGRFAFPPQPPTNWFLTASAPGRVPRVLYVDLRSVDPRVEAKRESPDALTIDLDPCAVFARGEVRDGGGGPIAGARIKLTRMWNNGGTEVATDPRGRYDVCVPPGSRTLTLIAEADGYGTVETLAYFAESRDLDFTLEPAASVAGRAVLGEGSPAARGQPAIKITLAPLPPANPNNPPIVGTQSVRLETVTDENGRFQLDGLAAGRYRVQAGGDELSGLEVDQQIGLQPGEKVRDLEVRLTLTSLVEGIVRRAGVPAVGVVLSFDVRGTPTVPPGHSVLYPFALSGPDGRYQVRLKRGAVVDSVLGRWPRNLAPRGFTVTAPHMTGVDLDIP